MLLIADGGASPAAERRARELKDAGYSLSILGVGTQEGAPIPKQSGGFVTDQCGRIAVPQLESNGLRRLAAAGGGRYVELDAGNGDLDALFTGDIIGAGRAVSDDTLATDRWREEGPWLVLLLLPLGALAFRRGWVIVLLFAVVPLARPVQAAEWADLWLNKNQQAQRELESGNTAAAVELFDDPEWQGVARYRAEDFAGSADQFARREDTRSLYNMGNALAMQGELDKAIDAYENVLELEPDNEDAQHNLDLVKSLKDQQQQAQQSEGDDASSTQNPSGDGEQSEQQSDRTQDGSDGQSDGEPDNSEMAEREEEMSEEDMQALQEELQRAAEEAGQDENSQPLSEAELAERREQQAEQQAMEQWLRRVPDDPGGLLRNKFRYQYKRSGRDQDGNSVWPDNEVQPW